MFFCFSTLLLPLEAAVTVAVLPARAALLARAAASALCPSVRRVTLLEARWCPLPVRLVVDEEVREEEADRPGAPVLALRVARGRMYDMAAWFR